jgi:aminopeptidase-like protein
MRRPNRRYSYRLVIAPELIGTVHWLAGLPDAETSRFKAAVMLKSLGNESDLKLQQSFTGKHLIDRAAHHIYRQKFNTYKSAAFRALYGNDETVFEAPGFEIPSISMTRFPFPTYHTNMDTPQALSPAALDESLDTLLGIIDVLEWNDRFKANFKGLVALSSPKYDLYLAASAPGIDREAYDAQMGQWNLLMNCLPRHLDGETDLLAIAERYDLPFGDVRDYVEKWVSKGLAIRVEA